ncbi:hypothetical protein BD410DRAFT_384884 [Rickenella mellea]|uniref:Uncharacterized protein n=1 Tax=Rickenella mellea TaxID=50990 RepID=A0A4Y7PXR7_9AGAM|nr:hypothetical protein BD410DRAFT_384884 [Rickenella mellea]
MSNGDESEEWDDLVKISDDGPNNNFAEFELKNKLTLEVFDLWKYIEGPLSDPPVIPTLVTPKTVHGINIRTNEPCTLVTFGNAEEVRHAELDAEPWFHGDACALSKILDSVPDHKTHVVRTAKYAKQAWEALCSYYKRSNSIRAASIKWDIKSYLCDSSMDVRLWLNDMQRMYGQICAMDLDCMTDREFAMAILDLMPLDSGWRYFIARLREETLEKEADGVKRRPSIPRPDILRKVCCRN